MVSKRIIVSNPTGLHLRPAGNLCREALKYEAKISILIDSTRANAKSVLSVLGACVKFGDEIVIECNGSDEEAALEALVNLARSGFGENE